ncbi:MAG TPA: glycosyltransferase family 4 protein [Candidatus Nanoarchaeia archaeon]|nr:glycosyltransferase family 4 protein [Candidatus Nanoarchaeia archaeon]
MKILELTNYSAGSCGVFARVKKEALWLSSRGHQVRIFSSNLEKGTNQVMPKEDKIGKVKITRFSSTKLGGESFMRWNFIKDAIDFKPDVIIAHSYRHYHTHLALKVARIVGAKCFLVTHAPFTMNTRSPISKIAVSIYDSLIGPKIINQFDKVITITSWEEKYLAKIGCRKDKIVCIPNGIPEEFYNSKILEGQGMFFFGRVSPIKNIELLISALKDSSLSVDIIGPTEAKYKSKLLSQISKNNIRNVHFLPEIKDLKSKIKLFDHYEILVLPSKFESFGQVIVEAMARGKIVISSNTPGAREIIKDNKNGFLFEVNNANHLRSLIDKVSNLSKSSKKSIRLAALKRAEEFKLNKIMLRLESLL